MNQINEP
jgi:hypothetical protein